jgi:L-ascorbate metabolism protein UlaG (beta-lactamase superfamily)
VTEMKSACISVEFLGHATIFIKVDGMSILCDPHLFDNFRYGLFSYFPPRTIDLSKLPNADAIFLSHSHRDHFDTRSLFRLDRKTPIFCPSDLRIQHALNRMGFKEVIVVGDWSRIDVNANVRLLWTPSAYRVPELGLVLQFGDLVLWNLVDSVFRPKWFSRFCKELDDAKVDVLLLPCQPLLETEIYSAVMPMVPIGAMRETARLLRVVKPRGIVPFADGHYGLGPGRWLNHQKFPLNDRQLKAFLKEAAPDSRLLDMKPGDQLVVDASRLCRRIGKLSYVTASDLGDADRRYHPGGWIEPLRAITTADGGTRTLERVVHLASHHRASLVSAIIKHYGEKLHLANCTYQIIVVGCQPRQQQSVAFSISESGTLVPVSGRRETDIEVCVPSDDLTALCNGSLGYSAVYLSGRLREIRPGLAARPWRTIFGLHTRVKKDHKYVVSGVLALNLLLRRIPGVVTRELDFELEAWQRDLADHTAWNPSVRGADGATRKSVQGLESMPRLFWEQLELALREGSDFSGVPTLWEDNDDTYYLGLFGRHQWQVPRDKRKARGRLLLLNLMEAQPHMGAGVRFPEDGYKKLLSNIILSGIYDWSVLWSLPLGSRVAPWRLGSLFPVGVNRLRRDLAERGWTGRITARESGPRGDWWLGLPQLPSADRTSRISFQYAGCGRIVGQLGRTRADIYCGYEPQFMLEMETVHRHPTHPLLTQLVEASFRFSWLLTPDVTFRGFPEAKDLGFPSWTEKIAIAALAHGNECQDTVKSENVAPTSPNRIRRSGSGILGR